jgi:hypothetical protein
LAPIHPPPPSGRLLRSFTYLKGLDAHKEPAAVRIGDSGDVGRVVPRRGDKEETPVEARTSDDEDRRQIGQNRGDHRVSHAVHRGEKNPRFWLYTML